MEIKTTIENSFKHNSMSDARKITVTVHDGKVTLQGKAHTWQEKEEAHYSAWGTPGVSSVENNIVMTY
ncbi:MAG: BON domain-containing protein [Anaerolineales bacterium]|nr:BON domain-containing protein [Anaerolineales bacterium]